MSFGNKKKTTMNKILFILCLTSASLWMLSCTDYEVASYPEENETEVFNGTVLDYLSTGNERLNLKFDSMMVLVNNIPDGTDGCAIYSFCHTGCMYPFLIGAT